MSPRTYCAECRTSLPVGECIERALGFCTRGCWERWHRKHCAARGCGAEMPRKRIGRPIQYCGRKCRASARRSPPPMWPDSPEKAVTLATLAKDDGYGGGNPHETGTFLPLDSDRPSWVRQGPEHLRIDADGAVIARVFPVGGKWRVAVAGLRVIGPVAGPFDTVEEGKSAAATILLAAAHDDVRTRAILRRIERAVPRAAGSDETDHARAATERWIASFRSESPRLARSMPSLRVTLEIPAFLNRRMAESVS